MHIAVGDGRLRYLIQITKWKKVTEEQALDDDWDMISTLTAFAKTRDKNNNEKVVLYDCSYDGAATPTAALC